MKHNTPQPGFLTFVAGVLVMAFFCGAIGGCAYLVAHRIEQRAKMEVRK